MVIIKMTKCELKEKYYKQRSQLTEGCWFLCSKNRIISKTIRSSDKQSDGEWARFSHIGKVITKTVNGKTRFLLIDSNANGVKPNLLSLVIEDCDDFVFIKPLVSEEIIQESLERLFDRAERGIKYDFKNGFRELLNRRFGLNLKITKRDEHDICSDFTNQDLKDCFAVTDEFYKIDLTLPYDAFKYRNKLTTTIIN